jgi:integrase
VASSAAPRGTSDGRSISPEQDREQEAAGQLWHEGDWIFTSGPVSGSTFGLTTSTGRNLLREAGLRDVRLHDARHTRVAAARPRRPAARRPGDRGHSDIKVTMTVYAHGRLDEKAAALAQLSTVVAGTLPAAVAVNEGTDAAE